jgi:hypothetical protein
VPTDDEARELLALDVDEVSLVDRPAIRRKFSVVKALTEDEVSRRKTKNEGDTAPETLSADVVKMATPLLTGLASERLGVISNVVAELQSGLGTLSKDDACKKLYSLHDAIWAAERDVVAVSKALGDEVERVTAAKSLERAEEQVEKAHPRKMTARRLNEFKAVAEKFATLLKEFEAAEEDEDEDTPEEDPKMKTETAKNEVATQTPAPTSAPDIEAAVTAAVQKAVEPIATRLAEVEKKLAPAPAATTTAETTKAADTAPAWAVAIQKSLDDLGQRLDVVEAGSNAGGSNTTQTTTTKSDEPFWKGVLG